jgi:hypothetical protein
MKRSIGALLLTAPLWAFAATEHPDGSVTLTADESRVTVENFNALLAERQRMALIIIQLMKAIESTSDTQQQTSGGEVNHFECI